MKGRTGLDVCCAGYDIPAHVTASMTCFGTLPSDDINGLLTLGCDLVFSFEFAKHEYSWLSWERLRFFVESSPPTDRRALDPTSTIPWDPSFATTWIKGE